MGDMVKETPTIEQKKKFRKMEDHIWNKFDEDKDGLLNHKEYMNAASVSDDHMREIAGDDYPQFTDGENEFFWVMQNNMKNFGWNRWGRHGDGVSKETTTDFSES